MGRTSAGARRPGDPNPGESRGGLGERPTSRAAATGVSRRRASRATSARRSATASATVLASRPRPSPAPAARCRSGGPAPGRARRARPPRPRSRRRWPRRCRRRRSATRTLTSTCGQLGHRRRRPARRAAGPDRTRRSSSCDARTAGRRRWWPGRRSTMWPDCSPPSEPPVALERLEHVAVADLRSRPPRCPASAIARRKPRLVITVTTTVSPARRPRRAEVDGEQGDEVVAVDERARSRRRPAPGRRRRRRRDPTVAPRFDHRRRGRRGGSSRSRSLMLRPSGSAWSTSTSAPSRRSTVGGEAPDAAPLAQSTTTLQAVEAPALERAPPTASSQLGGRPGRGAAGTADRRRRSAAPVASSSSSTASSSASTSSVSLRPPAAKNLMPLSDHGLCEAEITAPGTPARRADPRHRRRRHARRGSGDGARRPPGPPASARLEPGPGRAGVAADDEARRRRRAPGPRRARGPRRSSSVSSSAGPRTPSVPNAQASSCENDDVRRPGGTAHVGKSWSWATGRRDRLSAWSTAEPCGPS